MVKLQIIEKIKGFFVKHFQLITRGYSYEDMWSLDCTISKFILPRLKEFRRMDKFGYPSYCNDMDEWNDMLDKMIFSFEYTVIDLTDDVFLNKDFVKDEVKRQEGLKLFATHFNHLWD